MKEILLKFETEDLFNEFINDVITPTVNDPRPYDDMKLEYDYENNIAILSRLPNENKEA